MIEEPRERFELRWRELLRAAGSATGGGLRPGAWALPLLAFAGALALALAGSGGARRSGDRSGQGPGVPAVRLPPDA